MSSVCENPRCRHCGELGHVQKNCPVRRSGKSDSRGAVSGSVGDSRSAATGSLRSGSKQAGGPTRSFSEVAGGVTRTEREERFVPDYARPEKSLPLASRLYDMVHDLADFKAMAQPDYHDGLLRGIEARRQRLEEGYRRELEKLRVEREKVLRDKHEAELMAAPLKRMMDAMGELETLCKKRRVSEAPATVSGPGTEAPATVSVPETGVTSEQMETQETPVEVNTGTSVEVKSESSGVGEDKPADVQVHPPEVGGDKPADVQVHPPEVERSKTAESEGRKVVDESVEEPVSASSSREVAQAGGSHLSEGSETSWADEMEGFGLEKMMDDVSDEESKGG